MHIHETQFDAEFDFSIKPNSIIIGFTFKPFAIVVVDSLQDATATDDSVTVVFFFFSSFYYVCCMRITSSSSLLVYYNPDKMALTDLWYRACDMESRQKLSALIIVGLLSSLVCGGEFENWTFLSFLAVATPECKRASTHQSPPHTLLFAVFSPRSVMQLKQAVDSCGLLSGV